MPYLLRLDLGEIPSSLADLFKAFRRMMFKAHPDYGGANQAAREVMEAYEMLKWRLGGLER
jgi:DnaJ-class molecular chaperone